MDAIAIVGMSCRFPGAGDVERYWSNLASGVESLVTPTDAELLAAGVEREALSDPAYVRACARLVGIDQFDAAFFKIAAREAELMDPQHRVFLECAFEALEDAGCDPTRFDGEIGVFAGATASSYWQTEVFGHPDAARWPESFQALLGNDKDYLALFTSYKLGLRGPSLGVQTACSTSLVALHMACASLRERECDAALCGGVTIRVPHPSGYRWAEGSPFSKRGRCRPFDASADGTVFGSGAAVAVLRRLEDALADGDPIRAIVLGSAVNNDGAVKVGFSAPSEDGQARVLAEALALAEVSAESVQYVEAHGTGTPLGDPIELAALRRAYAARRTQPCLIGSVKGNIGHLEAAAGMAGLFKTVLAFEQEELPPSLHFAVPNPALGLQDGLFEVVAKRRSWRRGSKPRRAGVSSFGIGGTNAHVVMQEAPALPARAPDEQAVAQPLLLPLSAHDATSLRALAKSWRDWLTAEQPCSAARLRDLAYTSALRRRHQACRTAVLVQDHASLLRELALLEDAELTDAVERKRPVVFVFPGSGVRWRGAGQQLWQTHAAFTQSLRAVAGALRHHGGCDVIELLTTPPADATADEPGVDIMQPCLFALEIALAAQWRAWGVVPDVVVGHSLGEVAAAHVAGALNLDDAARIVVQRSRLLKRLEGRGEMAVVALSEDQTRELLGRLTSSLEIAALNGPCATVVAGSSPAIAALAASCKRERVACRKLAVRLPFHSSLVEPLCTELAARLDGLRCRETSGPELWSSVTASRLSGEQLDARYWARNLREPVRFAPTIAQLALSGPASFVEVGPHPSLLVHLEATLSESGESAGSLALPTLRAGAELPTMLRSAAALFAHGAPLAWDQLHPRAGRRCVRLPRYPWQRQRFWMAPRPASAHADAATLVAGAHELLGARVLLATGPDLALWQVRLSADRPAFLADHKVGADTVVPATAFLGQVLTAALALHGRQAFELHDVELSALLQVPEQNSVCVQTILERQGHGAARFSVKSPLTTENTQTTDAWTTHCAGGVRTLVAQDEVLALDAIRERCAEHIDQQAFYRGLTYGPAFRGVQEAWRGEGEALVRVRVLSDAAYDVHPATLDACLQSLAAALAPDVRGPAVPVGISALALLGQPEQELWCHARLVSSDHAHGRIVGDITACDARGTVLLRVRGLSVQLLAASDSERSSTRLLVQQFRPQALTASAAAEPSAGGRWVIVSDHAGAGSVAADLARELELRGGMVSILAPKRGANDAAWDARLSAAFSGGQRARALVLAADVDRDSAIDSALAPTLQQLTRSVSAVQALLALGMRQTVRVYWLTRRAQALTTLEAVDPEQASLWGLRRSLAMEHPELRCTAIDLALADDVERRAVTAELLAQSDEEEIALRGDARWVARLAYEPLVAKRESEVAPGGRPYRLELDRPGSFDGLCLRARERRAPAAGEVELQVFAAGLNFIDVVKTLGLYPGLGAGPVPLGEELCGRVVRVGPGVTRLKEGQEVFGLASGAFGAYATTREAYLELRPACLSQIEAASVPVAFMTAAYALNEVARLRPGERVLIHSAASGTGLAALQLAQRAGARVLATAGTEQKRAMLRGLGVEHVFDSRDGQFASCVMKATAGEGVDVVLNALAGAAIEQGLAVLAEDGRFVELGKRDLYAPQRSLSMVAFRRRVSFHAVDLSGLAKRRPERIAALLSELAAAFSAGRLQALPVQARPIAQAAAALQLMAQGRHIGKLAVTLEEPATIVVPATETPLVRSDASYLISGGLGALGLVMARWLVEQGATTLVLLTRREPDQAQQSALAELRARGAEVRAVVADIADAHAVERVVADMALRGPPLRGVIHAAGVIEDAVIARQDHGALRRVLSPKAIGAWNLHAATRSAALDFMVGYGSAVGLLGAPGQGAYAAANCFLSALAQLRRASGLPGLVVEWGPFGEVGMGVRAQLDTRLSARGMELLSPGESPQLIAAMLRAGTVRAGVVPFDVRQWIEFFPQLAASTRLSELLAHAAEQTTHAVLEAPLRRELAATAIQRQPELVVTFVRKQVSELLRIDSERVGRDLPLLGLGVDSLVGLELRNRLARASGLSLPTTLVWTYATVAALAEYLLERLSESAAPEAAHAQPERERAPEPSADYELVEGEALLSLFDAELAALEDQV